MDVFHLSFDIDSSSQPELHKMLAALHDQSFHGERIRQLAATGLIWERLRLRPEAVLETPLTPPDAATNKRLALVTGAKAQMRSATRIPVLWDVVPQQELLRVAEHKVSGTTEMTPPAERPGQPASKSTTPPEAIDHSPTVHMPGSRSRLMRMKNRGLFNNE